MQFQKILVPLGSAALIAGAYYSYGWRGVAIAAAGLMMWLLLHFTRMMHVLKRAADRPVGYVDSAVMLNAKLRPGLPLLHVVAMTKALGQPQDPENSDPERFRWTDGSQSHVTCEFRGGKLSKWELVRPAQTAESDNDSVVSPAP